MNKKNKKLLILGIIGGIALLIIIITIFSIMDYNYGKQTYSVEKISLKIPKKWKHIHDKNYGEYFYPFKDSTDGMLYVATTNIDDAEDVIIDEYFDGYISGIKEGYKSGYFKINKKEKIKVLDYNGIKVNFYCTIDDEKYEQQLYAFIDTDNGILYSFLNAYKKEIPKRGEKELKRIIDSIVNKDSVKREKIDNTICYFKYNEKEADGMTSRINYNAFFRKNKKIHEESLTKYVFENDDLAYKYYTEHVEELKSYGNEVHLINNIMNIFNDKKMSDEEATFSITLHKELESTCKVNDSSMKEKYKLYKKEFENEKNKSSEYIENKNKTQNNSNSKQETKEESKKETSNNSNQNNYMEALRKCSVMEAADIYTTGIGKKSDNVFNDGRKTCESWYKQWGEKDFLEAVNEDWKNRQNEEIDGKPLSYYLDILGW